MTRFGRIFYLVTAQILIGNISMKQQSTSIFFDRFPAITFSLLYCHLLSSNQYWSQLFRVKQMSFCGIHNYVPMSLQRLMWCRNTIRIHPYFQLMYILLHHWAQKRMSIESKDYVRGCSQNMWTIFFPRNCFIKISENLYAVDIFSTTLKVS